MSRAKLNQVLKGRCPVCHFEEFHLVSCQLGQSEALAEEAIQRGVELWKVLYHYTLHSRTVRRLLAETEELSERRKKALEVLADWPHQSERYDGKLTANAVEGLANVRRFARAAITDK
ncbi:hypothetical protein LCGC14_1765160 [marine sediment metagenome]|uniref:Uncharacterized protein n=1 Tax=marine sediment metagenome TaxID=412755 RepID=A0A0F9JEV2_9ZZZZ